jgi:DNA-binding SARP family transcriptional activator
MEAQWRIELLGKFKLTYGGLEIDPPPSKKSRELLACLVLQKDRLQSRTELIGKLWPDLDLQVGRRALSSALGALRRLTAEARTASHAPGLESCPLPILVSDIGVQAVPAKISTDVHEYMQLLDRLENCTTESDRLGLLLQAQRLYAGPLLPGWTGEWVCLERKVLSAMHQRVLLQTIAIHSKLGQPDLALEQALRAITLFPTDERAHERAMELYVRCGRRAEALRQYQELSHVLWLSTGGKPSASATRLARSIGWVESQSPPFSDPAARHPALLQVRAS